MPTKPKIIQIAAAADAETGDTVYALCDDGSVSFYDFGKHLWYELAPISQCKKLETRRFVNKETGEFIREVHEYPA
jgi:hypothetical protein